MPAAARFVGSSAGPARVAVQGASPAARVLAVVAAATSPATTSVTAPRIMPGIAPAPLSDRGAAAAARVIGLARQAVQSAAPVLRPTATAAAARAPASRLRAPVYAAAAPPASVPESVLGPVYAAPAAFDLPLLTPNWGGGGSSSSYADDTSDDAWDDVPTFAATPMQTRSMLGVEAPTSVWWIVAGAGVAALAYHLYRRDFAGMRRP